MPDGFRRQCWLTCFRKQSVAAFVSQAPTAYLCMNSNADQPWGFRLSATERRNFLDPVLRVRSASTAALQPGLVRLHAFIVFRGVGMDRSIFYAVGPCEVVSGRFAECFCESSGHLGCLRMGFTRSEDFDCSGQGIFGAVQMLQCAAPPQKSLQPDVFQSMLRRPGLRGLSTPHSQEIGSLSRGTFHKATMTGDFNRLSQE